MKEITTPGNSSSTSTAEEIEAQAMQMVLVHQRRISAAANEAFRSTSDPLRGFAEAVAYSNVIHIRAMLCVNAAHRKRLEMYGVSGPRKSVQDNDLQNTPPATDLLRLLGIYPADTFRFRAWALGITLILLLAMLGAGVIIGRAGA